jgi:hypothetical protein
VVASIKLQVPRGTSGKSLVRSFALAHQTEGSTPCGGILPGHVNHFLWYAANADWVDDARLLYEWPIRELLDYVATKLTRWAKEGSGSIETADISKRKSRLCGSANNYL